MAFEACSNLMLEGNFLIKGLLEMFRKLPLFIFLQFLYFLFYFNNNIKKYYCI